jgi:hypothetical protein
MTSWGIPFAGKSPHLTCDLQDGTTLSLKKNTDGSSSIQVSTADGLIVTFLPNGKVSQSVAPPENLSGKVDVELGRTISPDVRF